MYDHVKLYLSPRISVVRLSPSSHASHKPSPKKNAVLAATTPETTASNCCSLRRSLCIKASIFRVIHPT
eukprot:3592487-Prymnesium_polylepis.1